MTHSRKAAAAAAVLLLAAVVLAGVLDLGRNAARSQGPEPFLEFLGTKLGMTEFALARIRSPQTAARIGAYYLNGGAYDLDRAEAAFRAALDRSPEYPRAHFELARIAFLQGALPTALAEVMAEIKAAPDFPNAYYLRGLIEGYGGNYAAAQTDFQRFISFLPHQWAGYNDLAWVQSKLGAFQDARSSVLLAFERLPGESERNPWLWTSLGVAELNLGRYDEAKTAFLKAALITERFSPRYFWSAYPGNNPADADAAFAQFRAALDFNLGLAYEKLGNRRKALEHYELARSLRTSGGGSHDDSIKRRINALNEPPS